MLLIAVWGFTLPTPQAIFANNLVIIFNEDLIINWSLYILLVFIAFSRNDFLSTFYYVGVWLRHYKIRLILCTIILLVSSIGLINAYVSPSKNDVVVIIKNNLLRLSIHILPISTMLILYTYFYFNHLPSDPRRRRSALPSRYKYVSRSYVGKKSR